MFVVLMTLACVAPRMVTGKVLRGTIKLDGEQPEAYISKFSINEEGLIVGSLRTANAQPFNTGFVNAFSHAWATVFSLLTCYELNKILFIAIIIL